MGSVGIVARKFFFQFSVAFLVVGFRYCARRLVDHGFGRGQFRCDIEDNRIVYSFLYRRDIDI